MPNRVLSVLFGLLLVTGCSETDDKSGSPAEDGGVTKDDARSQSGKNDTGNDLCEINNWYGDGECDTFCPAPDTADCEAEGGQRGDGQAGGEDIAYFFTDCKFGGSWVRLHDIAVGAETTLSAANGPTSDQEMQILAGLKHEWGGEGSPANMDEAYDATDDKKFLVTELEVEENEDLDREAGRWLAYRYYAGDNEVGFFFEVGGDEVVLSIGDGEIFGCISGFESKADAAPDLAHWIALASLSNDLVDLHTLDIGPQRVLKSAADATDLEKQQVLAGMADAAPANIDEAFDWSDDGEFLLRTLTDPESGNGFIFYRYWAGDTAVGFVVGGEDADVTLTLGDGEISDISVKFQPNP